jgi:hypothetical protein
MTQPGWQIPPPRQAPPAQGRPSRRGRKVAGGLLMLVGAVTGVLVAISLLAGVGHTLADGLTGPVRTSPFQAQVQLKHTRYLIMQATRSSGGGIIANRPPSITADDVQVTGPDGTPVAVSDSRGNFQLDRNGLVFVDVLGFDADPAGSYQVAVTGTAGAQFLLVRDLGRSFTGARPKLLGIGLCLLTFLVGFVLLVTAFAGRRAGRPAVQVPFYPPGQQPTGQRPPGQRPGGWAPGWYADPRSGRPRYWDGYRWQP